MATPAIAPMLFLAGVGHALGFSPLAHRLTTSIRPAQAAELSGLILTASVLGQVAGVAGLVGGYLSLARHHAANALATISGISAALLAPAAIGAASNSPEPLAQAESSGGYRPLTEPHGSRVTPDVAPVPASTTPAQPSRR